MEGARVRLGGGGQGHPFSRRARAALVAAVVLASGVITVTSAPTPASAVSAAEFIPGYIISDELFYDNDALTASQIQYFLDSKIGTCTNGQCLNVAVISYPGRAREVSSKTGNLICEAIPAGTVSAAELIYRAQVACGVSAKVILVTLQKEQGLVTSSAPSDSRLRWAMGMACPDTAACDTAFAGLGTQIAAGTRQLKAYKAAAFARQPGTHTIGYHPNAACGSTSIVIRNYATAALYNYTPYQPNAAALANLRSTGDSCSSYGNRNFWVYYNDWFGSSVSSSAADAITGMHLVLGGAGGPLGAVVESPACGTATSCLWVYEHGAISWTSQGGPVAVSGAIGAAWLTHREAFGRPLYPESVITDPHGNGTAQQFARGWVHAGPAGAFWSPTALMTTYSAAGWLRGALGWPTSEFTCGGQASVCVQWFAGGAITGPAAGPMSVVRADLASAYLAAGGTGGELGFPLLAAQQVTDPNGNGVAWKLESGWIHASSRGAFSSSSAMMAEYSKRGWLRGPLGWPIAEQTCEIDGCDQQFAGGTIHISAEAAMTNAAIAAVWRATGGAAGELGMPLGSPQAVTDKNGDGVAQRFERGWIHSSVAGVFASPSSVMAEYSRQGWVRGWLGWPAGACLGTPCTQEFAGGTIAAALDGTARSMPAVSQPEIRALYDSLGGVTGSLGAPLLPAQAVVDPHGNGFAQKFEKGWVHSSSAGTFATSNALMSAYSSHGWLRGPLGWPTEAETCTPAGCGQRFAGGLLYAPIGAPAFLAADVTNPQIKALHDSLGGSAGSLGYAIQAAQSIQDPQGDGFAQRFEHGWIHSSARGTYSSPSVVMAAYSAAGWLRGPLGWPISEPLCGGSAGACVQSFAGGVISATSTSGGVLPAAIATAYAGSGGPEGPWGYPLLGSQTISDPNGNGYALRLERGWVHSSARGTFFSTNAVMTEYSARGWIRGPLGWPTAGEACDALGCAQAFSGGVIRYRYGSAAALVPTISSSAISAAWQASGGAAGSLGFPVGATKTITDPNGDGFAQQFERGWIHSGAAGTFVTPSIIMTRYSALGWLRAPSGIGWPVSAVTCDATGCTQTFASASIRVPVGELMTEPSITAVWEGLGGIDGALGAPLQAVQVVTDPNGDGFAQQFERGWIHASAVGAFWSPSIVMSEYSAQGWVRGALAWPTANAECLPGGCVQTFEHGTIDTR